MTSAVDELRVERALVRFFAGSRTDIVANADGGFGDAQIYIGTYIEDDRRPSYLKPEFKHVTTIKLRELAAAICRGEFS